MKKYNQFISESYAQDLISGKAKDWDGPAARAVGKHVMKKGRKVGTREPGTNYQTYDLDGQKFKVADKSGVPYLVHRLSENFVLPDGGRMKKGTVVKWKGADGKEVEGKITGHDGGRYIDEILVTKSKSKFYKPGDYAYDVNASDIGLTFKEDIEQIDEIYIHGRRYGGTAHPVKKLPSLKVGTKISWKWASGGVASGVVDYNDGKQVIDVKYLSGKANGLKRGEITSINVSDVIREDIANAAGGPLGSNPSTNSIAGYDPMLSKKPLKRSKFAGTEVFEVDNDTFQKCHTGHGKYERWDKYLKQDCESCKAIREYAKRYPQKDIIIQRAGCKTLTYLKRKGVHY